MKAKKRAKKANPALIANVVHDVEQGVPIEDIIAIHNVDKAFVYRHSKKASNRRSDNTSGGARVKEAIVYLSHAEKAVSKKLRDGSLKKLCNEHLLMFMALNALRGEV